MDEVADAPDARPAIVLGRPRLPAAPWPAESHRLASRGDRRSTCCLRAVLVVLVLAVLPQLARLKELVGPTRRSSSTAAWERWQSRRLAEADRDVNLKARVDLSAVDLFARNYFINQREKIVEEIQDNAFARDGPVITTINAAIGDRITINSLGLDITEPNIHLLGVSLRKRSHSSIVDLDLDLACWLNFEIDMQATGHVQVAPWRRFGNTTSRVYRALVDASLRMFSNRSVGDYSHGISAQVMGHIEGRSKVVLTLDSTEHDALPRPTHFSPRDATDLKVYLDDYTVNWLWIKRMRLVPIRLLERVVNVQLQHAFRDHLTGWPIESGHAAEVARDPQGSIRNVSQT